MSLREDATPVGLTARGDPARDEVRHYCPGGRENGGGIGRMVGHVVDAARAHGADHRVVDTRGPRFRMPASAWPLLVALGGLVAGRLTAPGRIHHLHVAGRGSTARKLILAGAARALGCRHVLHLHDYDYGADLDGRSPWMRRRVAAMFCGADRVIVLGQRDRAVVETRLGVESRRIAVIPNAVPDPSAGRPGRQGDAAGEGPRIVFLGRLSDRKGVPVLLRALAEPDLSTRRWTVVLAGDGPVEDYRAVADALGLADRVRMTGWLGQAEVSALCADADIMVLPSEAEGLAMAVLEGLAHGLAVVTTRVGAHDEVLTDGVDGLFVPVGDASALAATLARLIDDPALRSRLGSAARARFLSAYALPVAARRIGDVYRDIGAARRPTHISQETAR